MQGSHVYVSRVSRSHSNNRRRTLVTVHISKMVQQVMDKHKPADEMIKDLDNILSKLNAMEIVAATDFEKNSIKIQRALITGQIHTVNEFQHMKKALDLLTLQLFEVQNKVKS